MDNFLKFSSFSKLKAIDPIDEKPGTDFSNVELNLCNE